MNVCCKNKDVFSTCPPLTFDLCGKLTLCSPLQQDAPSANTQICHSEKLLWDGWIISSRNNICLGFIGDIMIISWLRSRVFRQLTDIPSSSQMTLRGQDVINSAKMFQRLIHLLSSILPIYNWTWNIIRYPKVIWLFSSDFKLLNVYLLLSKLALQ